MHYDDGAFWRPLSENSMFPLQVASGCTYNACRFCDMYHKSFSVADREAISADIDEIASEPAIYRGRIFLTGGNAFALPMDILLPVLEEIREKITPHPSIGCFARITDVARKSNEELQTLSALGVSDISIGSESGYDYALAKQNKGFDSHDVIEQCRRLDNAGLSYNLFLLLGMAGAGRCQEEACATVSVYDQANPKRIMIHTMTAFSGTPLFDDIESGDFEPAGEIEMLEELRTFIARTRLETYILGNHIGNVARVNGFLPEQREAMLDYIDHLIAQVDESQLRHFRSMQRSI